MQGNAKASRRQLSRQLRLSTERVAGWRRKEAPGDLDLELAVLIIAMETNTESD